MYIIPPCCRAWKKKILATDNNSPHSVPLLLLRTIPNGNYELHGHILIIIINAKRPVHKIITPRTILPHISFTSCSTIYQAIQSRLRIARIVFETLYCSISLQKHSSPPAHLVADQNLQTIYIQHLYQPGFDCQRNGHFAPPGGFTYLYAVLHGISFSYSRTHTRTGGPNLFRWYY